MTTYNGTFSKYAAEKIKDLAIDHYRATGKRSTHIELDSPEEKSVFLKESRKLGEDFRVEQIASLIYTIHYLGD